MARQTNVLLLLLAICIAAGALALFVHDMNTVGTPPAQVAQTPVAPLRIDQVATTTVPVIASSTPSIHEYRSKDGVTSAIVITEPGESLDNDHTFVVDGTSTAFENQMHWRLVLEDHTVLTEGSVYVSSTDSGIPGPFQITGGFSGIPKLASGKEASSATLEIYEPSPKDGTPLHGVDVPLEFQLGWPD